MSDKRLLHERGSLLVDALMGLLLVSLMVMLFVHALGIWSKSQKPKEGVDIYVLYLEGSGIYDD